MKTLKHKILVPHFFIIIMIPICICLILNIAIKGYSSKASKQELMEVADSVDKIFTAVGFNPLRNEILDEIPELTDFDIIRASLQASQFYNNTEFFLYSEDGTVLISQGEKESMLNDVVIQSAIMLLSDAPEDKIETFKYGLNDFHVLYKKMSQSSSIMIYVSSGHYTDSFVSIVNIALGIISLIFTSFALYCSSKVANSLSTPIVDLSKKVKLLHSGDQVDIDNEADCLEIVNLKHSINSMSTRLDEYDKAQKSFLLNASHELRTPLMSIGGYAEGISNGIFDNPQEMADVILEESKRLNVLVDKLLTLSRIENNVLSIEKINLSDVIKDYVLKMKGYALNHNVDLVLNIANNELVILADDSMLAQAVINIISNCTRYAKTSVTIDVYKDRKMAVLRIRDDGNGIAHEDLPHIFERFFKGKGGNLGLGLSISKTAVEYMNGTIEAYNNSGAVFEIRFDLIK
ncbi:MAG: HAMP domain-containing sensor histidine kinase [Clostridia bacterium]